MAFTNDRRRIDLSKAGFHKYLIESVLRSNESVDDIDTLIIECVFKQQYFVRLLGMDLKTKSTVSRNNDLTERLQLNQKYLGYEYLGMSGDYMDCSIMNPFKCNHCDVDDLTQFIIHRLALLAPTTLDNE